MELRCILFHDIYIYIFMKQFPGKSNAKEFFRIEENIYRGADIYLGTKMSPSTRMLRVSIPEKETKMLFQLPKIKKP